LTLTQAITSGQWQWFIVNKRMMTVKQQQHNSTTDDNGDWNEIPAN